MRDLLLKILKLDPEFSIMQILTNLEEFGQMVSASTPIIIELLNESCNFQTKSSKEINTLLWPRSLSALQYRTDSCFITKETLDQVVTLQCEDQDDEPTRINKTVTIKMIDLRWFMHSDTMFFGLAKILTDVQSEQIFTTEFVAQVLDQFWDEIYNKFLWLLFMPYLACLLSTIYYL